MDVIRPETAKSKSAARRAAAVAIAVAAALLLGCAAILTVAAIYPRAAAERIATLLAARPVSIDELDIHWGGTIAVRLRGLRIATAPGAGETDLARIAEIDAELDSAALLTGRLRYTKLAVAAAHIDLQRDANGLGNWVFAYGRHNALLERAARRLAPVPVDRTRFPDLLAFALADGEIRFRTGSGAWLSIVFDTLGIASTDSASPVAISATGKYQGIPAKLDATAASFDALRDAARPYEASLDLQSPGLHLGFRGTFADPLDLDGAAGELDLTAAHVAALLDVFGVHGDIAADLSITGKMTRRGDLWTLAAARGKLAGNVFAARKIELREGARRAADAFDADIAFASLDVETLLPAGSARPAGMRPADAAMVDLRLAAAVLRYGKLELARDASLTATVRAGALAVTSARATAAGGALTGDAALQAHGTDEGRLRLNLRLRGARAERLAALGTPGTGPAPVTGAIDGTASMDMAGTSWSGAIARGTGHVAVAMREGAIARRLIEAASADLRALFRGSGDTVALRCLFAAAAWSGGNGEIGPLRIRAANGALEGAGTFDPAARTLDLRVRTDPATTGTLALDIPLRIHGALADPSVEPAGPAPFAVLRPLPALPPGFARGNPCALEAR